MATQSKGNNSPFIPGRPPFFFAILSSGAFWCFTFWRSCWLACAFRRTMSWWPTRTARPTRRHSLSSLNWPASRLALMSWTRLCSFLSCRRAIRPSTWRRASCSVWPTTATRLVSSKTPIASVRPIWPSLPPASAALPPVLQASTARPSPLSGSSTSRPSQGNPTQPWLTLANPY